MYVKNKYSKDIISIILLAVIIFIYFLLKGFDYATIIDNIIKINNKTFTNNIASKIVNLILIFSFIILLICYLYAKAGYDYIKNLFDKIYLKIKFIFSINTLLIIIIIYTITLTILSIKNYDLGIDESFYIICSKNFFSKLSSFVTYNDNTHVLDYFSMFPLYIMALINYSTGLTSLWHFKLLASIISIISIIILYFLSNKAYNKNVAVIFLLLVAIQPGFGYVSFSFFGEVAQAPLFFGAIYYWLQDKKPIDLKKILIVSILFSLAIHTKFQLLYAVIPSLLIFIFIDKTKKSIQIIIYTLVFVLLLIAIRLIPSFIEHKITLHTIILYWIQIGATGSSLFNEVLIRMHLFNVFISFPLVLIFLMYFVFLIKTSFDKYLLILSSVNILWWILFWRTVPYRIFFIILIPILLILSICINHVFEILRNRVSINIKSIQLLIFIFLLSILFYGVSSNFTYAIIGYSDGEQFDLDGSKSLNFNYIKHDTYQKDFYAGCKNLIPIKDTIYVCTEVSQAMTVTQFYLPENPVFDSDYLKKAIELPGKNKFAIVDRVSFPMDINEGRKILDSLNVNKTLILKDGEYELYSINKSK